jgi:hypothetical protein
VYADQKTARKGKGGVMEIKIKRCGAAKGTTGWLAKGLETGDLYFMEGTLAKNGNHGLWLKSHTDQNSSTLLAAFNQYDLTESECRGSNRYTPIDDFFQGQWGTDAFWESLQNVARAWCDECNAMIDADKPLEIGIIRAT